MTEGIFFLGYAKTDRLYLAPSQLEEESIKLYFTLYSSIVILLTSANYKPYRSISLTPINNGKLKKTYKVGKISFDLHMLGHGYKKNTTLFNSQISRVKVKIDQQ